MPATKYTTIDADVNPLPNDILVVDMEQGDRVSRGGIIIRDDNGKDHGIRPRWARVYKVGSNVDFVKPDEWVLMEHGRWTFGIKMEFVDDEGNEHSHYLQKIDADAILLVSEDKPELR